MPAASFHANKVDMDFHRSLLNAIGEFADKSCERVEEIQRRVNELGECGENPSLPEKTSAPEGEKLPLPVPEKLTGEDSSIDIRVRRKQIERYLRAKGKAQNQWGPLAFAFVEKSAEAVWNAELTELENEKTEVTWEHFTNTMISYFGTQLPAREA